MRRPTSSNAARQANAKRISVRSGQAAGPAGALIRPGADAIVPVTVTVTFVAPLTVTGLAGLKLHTSPEGSPGQLRFTGPLKPFCGVIVICIVPSPLDPSETVGFDELREKSAAAEAGAHTGAFARLNALMLPSPVARS